MPGPEQVIRTVVGLPWAIARRLIGSLPVVGGGDEAEARSEGTDPEAAAAATEALERDREAREEAIFTPDDDFFDDDDHVEAEVELVAESADAGATESPGAQIHVDEPWDGYRRMRVAEITAQLEGQPPEVLAAVELYETTHRNRRGVLEAVRTATRG